MERAADTWTGEWWKHGGGGTVWNAMTYDPEFNAIYLGTGNGAPWNHKIRSPGGGDNLFLSSIVALDADTGAYRWHYQTTPSDNWDYTAMDLAVDIGQPQGTRGQWSRTVTLKDGTQEVRTYGPGEMKERSWNRLLRL